MIDNKFNIGQKVKIIDIDQPGRVSKIEQDWKNLWYEVQYWWEGQLKFVKLSEEEIE